MEVAMKHRRKAFALLVVMLSGVIFGLASEAPKGQRKEHTGIASVTSTRLNINNISTPFRNDGWADRDPVTGNAGLVFPKGTGKTAIFQSGFVWGAKRGDSLHVGGATYNIGLQPGKILSPGVPEDPNLPKNRVYRVRPDYATADLSVEASEEGRTQEEVRAQYALDWNQWPAMDGAPFYDRNNNGTYEPSVDVPGKYGASQTIWFVCNDLDTAKTISLYGTRPLSIEMQVTIWAYQRQGALGNMVFKHYRLLNKSTLAFDSMYVCQWSDPDVGDYSDDFVGCDTTLGMSYSYNSRPVDNEYAPLTPPAVGYQLLGFPMTASFYFAAGGQYSDPPFNREGARQWYNLLKGLTPITGAPFIHPRVPSQPTKFWLDGDPITGTGRIDGVIELASDRRMGACYGPFTMLPGTSRDFVVAQHAGMGSSYLSSISVLRTLAAVARSSYNGIMTSAPPIVNARVTLVPPSQATVSIVADGRPARAQSFSTILRRQDGSVVSILQLFDDGLHGDGGPGDGIWGNAVTINREPAALYADANIVDSLSRAFTWEHIYDGITTAGQVKVRSPRIFSDNINNNGEVNPGENVRYGFTVANLTIFPVSALRVMPQPEFDGKIRLLPFIAVGSVDSMLYNQTDPLSYFTFSAPYTDSVFSIAISLSDSSYNTWRDTISFTIVPFPQPIQQSLVNHVAGRSEWLFRINVVNSSVVQNHLYELTFADSLAADTTFGDTIRIKLFTLRDLTTTDTLLRRHPLPDQFGHNIPVTQGFKVMRGNEDFGKVGLRRDSTRWISTQAPWLRGYRYNFSEDTHSAFDGGATTGYQLGRFYLGAVRSSFNPDHSYTIEVRFDSTRPQKAYRLRRTGPGSSYLIQSPNPFVNVPFSVWDVTNPATPRQLTLAWRDQDNSGTWNPAVNDDGIEVVFIYNKTYDPTGTTQFSMPPNALPNECTVGANADIVYGLSLAVRQGHVLNESPGTLYLRPVYALTTNDRFTFNPTIVLGVPVGELPVAYRLYQNYPNPFNPATTIKYELPVQSTVTLTIYTILGQKVKTLVSGVEDAGVKQVQWDGRNERGLGVATGVYFYRLEARAVSGNASFTQVKKMLLLR
jgi:hypothetical protein